MKDMANLSHLSSYINWQNTGINLLALKKLQIPNNHKIIESFRLYKTVKIEPNPIGTKPRPQVPHSLVLLVQMEMCVPKPLYSHTTTQI